MQDSKLEQIEKIFLQYNPLQKVSQFYSFQNEYNDLSLLLVLKLNHQDTVLSIRRKIYDIIYMSYAGKVDYSLGYKKIVKSFLSDEWHLKYIGTLEKYTDIAKEIERVIHEH